KPQGGRLARPDSEPAHDRMDRAEDLLDHAEHGPDAWLVRGIAERRHRRRGRERRAPEQLGRELLRDSPETLVVRLDLLLVPALEAPERDRAEALLRLEPHERADVV